MSGKLMNVLFMLGALEATVITRLEEAEAAEKALNDSTDWEALDIDDPLWNELSTLDDEISQANYKLDKILEASRKLNAFNELLSNVNDCDDLGDLIEALNDNWGGFFG